jgi:protein SCO1/2
LADNPPPPRSRVKRVRLLLWGLVLFALLGTAALLLLPRAGVSPPQATTVTTQSSFGGPFTLVGADGKPFSSSRLQGKPVALFFGFTRCGDVCPTTLARLVKLRQQAGRENALNIVFVTIDPDHDGPAEVGQYAALFNSPIIGLTGSPAQIDRIKKQYGIHAQPTAHAGMGQEMEHTASVLLLDKAGQFVTTISPGDADSAALEKMRGLVV